MSETLGMLLFGNLAHGDKMLQNEGLEILLLRPTQESWSRFGPWGGGGEKDFLFHTATIPQPP